MVIIIGGDSHTRMSKGVAFVQIQEQLHSPLPLEASMPILNRSRLKATL